MKVSKHLAAAIFSTIAFAGLLQAEQFETFVNNDSTIIEADSFTKIKDKAHILLFNRLALNYRENNTNFLLSELGFGLPKGFSVLAQAKLFNDDLTPAGGLGYTKINVNTFFTTALTVGRLSSGSPQGTLVVIFDRKLKNDLRVEFMSLSWLNDGQLTGAFRPKIGLQFKDKYVIGIRGEIDYSLNSRGRAGIYFQIRK